MKTKEHKESNGCEKYYCWRYALYKINFWTILKKLLQKNDFRRFPLFEIFAQMIAIIVISMILFFPFFSSIFFFCNWILHIWNEFYTSKISLLSPFIIGQKFQKVENDENRFFAITSSKLFKNWFCKGHIFSNNIFHNHCFLYVL